MTTAKERQDFEKIYGYPPCTKSVGGNSCMACWCDRKKDHDGPCKCKRCGSEYQITQGP